MRRKRNRKKLDLLKFAMLFFMSISLFFVFFYGAFQSLLVTSSERLVAYEKKTREYVPALKQEVNIKNTNPITITFVGDLLMDLSVKNAMNIEGIDYPFEYVSNDLQQADLAVANLETPLTTRDESYKDLNQRFNFQSNPKHIQGLINAGFDLVSLANNHALDYGEEGLEDTMMNLDKFGLDYVGVGKTSEEAFQSQTYDMNGTKVSIMAASRFVPHVDWYTFEKETKAGVAGAYDLDYLVEKVKEEKKDTDFLILYIHWGIESTDTPDDYQKTYVKRLVEAGVDAIVGSHPHWLQGFEYYQDVPVAYSLGNFLFPNYITGNTAETGLLTLTILNNKVTMAFKPYSIENNQIVFMTDEGESRVLDKLERLSFDVEIDGYQIIDQR